MKKANVLKLTALLVTALVIPTLFTQTALGAQPEVALTVSQKFSSDDTVAVTDENSGFTVPDTAMDFVNASATLKNIELYDYNWTGEQDAHMGSYSIDNNYTCFSFECPYDCTLAYVSIFFEYSGTSSEEIHLTISNSYYNETMKSPMIDKWGFGEDFFITNIDSTGHWVSQYADVELDPSITCNNTWFISINEDIGSGNDLKVRWNSDGSDGDSDDETIVAFGNLTINEFDIQRDPISYTDTIDILATVILEPLKSQPNATECSLEINGDPASDGSSNDGTWESTTQPQADSGDLVNNVSVDWFNYSMDVVSRTACYQKQITGLTVTESKSFLVTTGYTVSADVSAFSGQCGQYRCEFSVPEMMERYGLKIGGMNTQFTTVTDGGFDLIRADDGVHSGTFALVFTDPDGERTSGMVQIGVYAGTAALLIVAGSVIMVKKKKSDDEYLLEKYGGGDF